MNRLFQIASPRMADWCPSQKRISDQPFDEGLDCDYVLPSDIFREVGEDTDAEDAILSAFRKIAKSRAEAELALRVSVLEKVVLELRSIISEISPKKESCVTVSSMASESLFLKKPITIRLEVIEDEYIATFFDAGIGAGGDTEMEAVSNLKSLIAICFRRLKAMDPKKLGPHPSAQLRVLEDFLTPTK